jgi:signal transduction histidine kinase
MSARIRSFDWSSTPLGPIATWPESLRTALSICLRSRFQLAIYWGPELVLLYNDAERDVLGTLHPRALGRPASEVLADIWDVVGPRLRGVLTTGEATWSVDQALRLNRQGFMEEAFFTFSYSPIPDASRTGGVMLVTVETTQRVLAERGLRTLRELASETAGAPSADEACGRAARVLADNPSDVPFSVLFLTEGERRFRLSASTGIAGAAEADRWPLREVALEGRAQRVEGVAARLPDRTTTVPRSALVLPIAQSGSGATLGCLVMGLSDFRALDESYRGFLDLVAGQIGTAVAGALAFEAERRRAAALAEPDAARTAFFSSEESLRQARDGLEQRVQERTHELAQANARLALQIAKRRKVEAARTELLHRLVTAQEEEHRRIARELHDDLTQRLAVLAIDAGTLERVSDSPAQVCDRARGMHEQLVALSESVHCLSRQLHPSIVDDLGLTDALRSECLSLEQRERITVRYHAKQVPAELPRGVALCVYRVAQEALRNLARHARSSHAAVRIVGTEGALVLSVRDRGVGFDVAARRKSGLGLESMRERARLIRARLSVRSRPGAGTLITLRVPLHRSQS